MSTPGTYSVSLDEDRGIAYAHDLTIREARATAKRYRGQAEGWTLTVRGTEGEEIFCLRTKNFSRRWVRQAVSTAKIL